MLCSIWLPQMFLKVQFTPKISVSRQKTLFQNLGAGRGNKNKTQKSNPYLLKWLEFWSTEWDKNILLLIVRGKKIITCPQFSYWKKKKLKEKNHYFECAKFFTSWKKKINTLNGSFWVLQNNLKTIFHPFLTKAVVPAFTWAVMQMFPELLHNFFKLFLFIASEHSAFYFFFFFFK